MLWSTRTATWLSSVTSVVLDREEESWTIFLSARPSVTTSGCHAQLSAIESWQNKGLIKLCILQSIYCDLDFNKCEIGCGAQES